MGIPLDPLALALDIPSEFSRQASFLTSRWASLTLVLEDDRQRIQRASLRSLKIFIVTRTYLILQGKEGPRRFTFLPVGRAFLGGSRCSTVSSWNS
jgi:hypothetical protein